MNRLTGIGRCSSGIFAWRTSRRRSPIRREAGSSAHLRFVFDGNDQDGYKYVTLFHSDTATLPAGGAAADGALNAAGFDSETGKVLNVPSLNSSSVLWAKIASNWRGQILVYLATSEAGLESGGSDALACSIALAEMRKRITPDVMLEVNRAQL